MNVYIENFDFTLVFICYYYYYYYDYYHHHQRIALQPNFGL